jgi:hypothetical protein
MSIGIICCKVLEKAQMIAKEFHLRLETTQGSLVQLENTLKQALNQIHA